MNRNMAKRLTGVVLFTTPVFVNCVHPTARAGRDADASISGVRADVRELNTALAQMKSEQTAGRDVNQNDKWTLRLLGLGVLMLGLSYPIGKIVWIATVALSRRARPGGSTPLPSPEDLMAFRQNPTHRADTLVSA